MFGQIRVAALNDPPGFASFSQALRDWEPQLEVYLPPRDARLFEPDGTLYAIVLADALSVSFQRRERRVAQGDLIVVPQGLALDIEPEVDLLGIRYDGPPPDHFRERFIQVWGFEHRATPPAPLERAVGRLSDIIPDTDVRHRMPYAIWDVPSATSDVQETGMDVTLLIVLEGEAAVVVAGGDHRMGLAPGFVAALGPGQSYCVAGPARLGRVILRTELVHQARRLDPGAASPEYPPTTDRVGEGSEQSVGGGGAGGGDPGPA